MCGWICGDLDDIFGNVRGLVHRHIVLHPLGTDAGEELRVCCPWAWMYVLVGVQLGKVGECGQICDIQMALTLNP